jgi:CTD small phosphatase-like protein 2
LQALQYIRSIQPTPVSIISQKLVYLPDTEQKVLIFDLDETLVHCVDDIEAEDPDVVLTVTFPNGESVDAGINVRPYAIQCLKAANE